MIHQGLSAAKAVGNFIPVDQERKCEDRRWLETVLFHALNDTISIIGTLIILGKPEGFGFWGEYDCKIETWRYWRKDTTRRGVFGSIW